MLSKIVAVGIIRGTGQNTIGAVVMLVSYYLVAWPLGIPLMFATSLGLYGMWIGLDVGILLMGLLLGVCILRFNWKDEAKKVSEQPFTILTEVFL